MRRRPAAALTVDVARVAWATLLLTAPDRVLAAAGACPTRERRLVVRILGIRHAAQAAGLIAVRALPTTSLGLVRTTAQRWAREGGAAVDLAHGLSSVGLAAAGRSRKPWAADGVVAFAFAAATWGSRDG